MKKYLIALLIIGTSCAGREQKEVQLAPVAYFVISGLPTDDIYVVEVDRCHYIVFDGAQKGGIVHKANCPNPQHK